MRSHKSQIGRLMYSSSSCLKVVINAVALLMALERIPPLTHYCHLPITTTYPLLPPITATYLFSPPTYYYHHLPITVTYPLLSPIHYRHLTITTTYHLQPPTYYCHLSITPTYTITYAKELLYSRPFACPSVCPLILLEPLFWKISQQGNLT